MYKSKDIEFQLMFKVEEKLWWYRILHEKVLKEIEIKFKENKDISILDVGCGTGGLLFFLKNHGYKNQQGIDYSDQSVKFSKSRGLKVEKLLIENILTKFDGQKFDVIICDDVFYCLEKDLIKSTLKNFNSLLKEDGIFLSNNTAFNIFWGTHDIAVDGKWRFTVSDFHDFTKEMPLKVVQHSYWSWMLSPLVLATRVFQRLKMKLFKLDIHNLPSDVAIPPIWLNETFYQLVKLEEKVLKNGFFGSSIFLKMEKVRN